MSIKKIRLVAYISKKLYDKLKAAADKEGRSISDFVHRVLDGKK
jgi:predicted CopG family antitoxin